MAESVSGSIRAPAALMIPEAFDTGSVLGDLKAIQCVSGLPCQPAFVAHTLGYRSGMPSSLSLSVSTNAYVHQGDQITLPDVNTTVAVTLLGPDGQRIPVAASTGALNVLSVKDELIVDFTIELHGADGVVVGLSGAYDGKKVEVKMCD